jgi:hypothetical protein
MRKVAPFENFNDKSQGPQITHIAFGWLPESVYITGITGGRLAGQSLIFLLKKKHKKRGKNGLATNIRQAEVLRKGEKKATIQRNFSKYDNTINEQLQTFNTEKTGVTEYENFSRQELNT